MIGAAPAGGLRRCERPVDVREEPVRVVSLDDGLDDVCGVVRLENQHVHDFPRRFRSGLMSNESILASTMEGTAAQPPFDELAPMTSRR